METNPSQTNCLDKVVPGWTSGYIAFMPLCHLGKKPRRRYADKFKEANPGDWLGSGKDLVEATSIGARPTPFHKNPTDHCVLVIDLDEWGIKSDLEKAIPWIKGTDIVKTIKGVHYWMLITPEVEQLIVSSGRKLVREGFSAEVISLRSQDGYSVYPGSRVRDQITGEIHTYGAPDYSFPSKPFILTLERAKGMLEAFGTCLGLVPFKTISTPKPITIEDRTQLLPPSLENKEDEVDFIQVLVPRFLQRFSQANSTAEAHSFLDWWGKHKRDELGKEDKGKWEYGPTTHASSDLGQYVLSAIGDSYLMRYSKANNGKNRMRLEQVRSLFRDHQANSPDPWHITKVNRATQALRAEGVLIEQGDGVWLRSNLDKGAMSKLPQDTLPEYVQVPFLTSESSSLIFNRILVTVIAYVRGKRGTIVDSHEALSVLFRLPIKRTQSALHENGFVYTPRRVVVHPHSQEKGAINPLTSEKALPPHLLHPLPKSSNPSAIKYRPDTILPTIRRYFPEYLISDFFHPVSGWTYHLTHRSKSIPPPPLFFNSLSHTVAQA